MLNRTIQPMPWAITFLLAASLWAPVSWGETADAVPDFVKPHLVNLSSPDLREREKAEEDLVRIGEPAVAPLITLLTSSDAAQRGVAARVLGKIGTPAVKPLIAALPQDTEAVRTDFARALANVGEPAVDLLIDGIMDRNDHIRWGCAIALGDIGDGRAVAPLIEGLHDKTWNSRMCTAMALGKIGDPAAVDALIEEMNNRTWPLRWSAVQALGAIGDPRAAAPLVKLLTDTDVSVNRDSARALTQLGKKAVPALMAAMAEENEELRGRAAVVLASIKDPRADEALRKYQEEQAAHIRAIQAEASKYVLCRESPWRMRVVYRTADAEVDGTVKPVLSEVPDWLTKEWAPAAGNWNETGFDDAGWLRGPAGIVFNTPFLSRLYLRGKFTVTDPKEVDGLVVSVEYHGGAVIYLNGREIVRGNLPPGGDGLIAESYLEEAFFTADSKVLMPSAPRTETSAEDARRLSLRRRALTDVRIPSTMVRKGVNVLAIEIVRSPYPATIADGKRPMGFGAWPKPYGVIWSTCELLDVSLKADVRRGLVTNTFRPEGLQVWNSDLMASDFETDYGDLNEPIRAVEIFGARNGSFSGKVVVGSPMPIRGLKATVTPLRGPQGNIGPESLRIRCALPWGSDASMARRSAAAYYFGMLCDKPEDVIPVRPQVPSRGDAEPTAYPKPIPGAVCPVWLTVNVPASARPGVYTGQLRILTLDDQPVTVPVRLTVEDYTLPDPQDYRTWIELIQSPDTLAVEYGVDLWSPEHFDLIAESMEYLKPIGSRVIYVPLIAHTNLGNAQSMVRWIPKPDGGYTWDFSVMERYLDSARRHMGDPKIVCFNVWDVFLMPEVLLRGWEGGTVVSARESLKGKGPVVTMLDPATGLTENHFLPLYSEPGMKEAWKSLFIELRRRLATRGLEKTMMIGMTTDWIPTREEFEFFAEVAPGIPWVSHSHGIDRSGQLRRFKESGFRIEMGYTTTVYTSHFMSSLAKGSLQGWKSDVLHAQFPRGDNRLDTHPATMWRLLGEMNVTGSQRGAGHLGADFWHAVKDKRGQRAGRVSARYPESSWTNLNIETSLLAPGPDGPCATARFEVMREGIQECEARILIERALSEEPLRQQLGEDLANRCRETLDERNLCMLSGMAALLPAYSWSDRAGGAGHLWFVGSNWQERSRKLYALAGEVQKKLGTR